MASMRSLFRPIAARAFSTTSRQNYAKIAVIGRLKASPELHASSSGKDYIKYSLATSHGTRDNERTSWWNVTSFPSTDGQRDYTLGLPKGTLLHLEADAEISKYTDEEAGKTRSSLNLVQRNIEVLARPKQAEPESVEEPQASAGAA